MLFLRKIERIQILLMTLPLLFWVQAPAGGIPQKVGYVSGTVVYVNKTEFLSLAPNVHLEFKLKGKVVEIISDNNGNVVTELPPGDYFLISVRDAKGNTLPLDPKQYKTLTIKSKKTTRFDVMLLK